MIKDNKSYNENVKPNTKFLNELKHKLPEFFINEKHDEEGKLVSEGYFDIEKFQESLKENNINEIREGYQLSFIGKDYAKKQSGERTTTVVVPDNTHNPEEINKNSKNLFFTGDNLEVLRHLQNNYINSIDVIYIDPPYNTGNDGFVYPDSFEYSDEVLQDVFGLNESELQKLKSIQGKSTHSAWLAFMYPRLKLAKYLMSESSVLFISINDSELSNLLQICKEELFGENNVEVMIWDKVSNQKTAGSGKMKITHRFRVDHEYIIVIYSDMNKIFFNKPLKIFEYQNEYGNRDNDERGSWLDTELCKSEDKSKPEGKNYYGITLPNGKEIFRQWHVTYEEFQSLDQDNRIYWGSGSSLPRKKVFLNDPRATTPKSVLNDVGSTSDGNDELQELFRSKGLFSNPKNTVLIKHLLEISTNNESIVLDFFAGSGTTADAVMQLNAEDGGNRKFIMVQLDEPTYEIQEGEKIARKGSETAFNAGYMSIDEISRERIKRSSQKIRDEAGLTLPENFDGGFKHYRVVKPTQASINDLDTYDPNTGMFIDSKGTVAAFSESGFDNMIQPFSSDGLGVEGGATGVDTILTTWMIQDGYRLDSDMKSLSLDGYDVYYVEESRVYLIEKNWNSNQTRMLLNKIGTYELNVQTIVLYGYSFGLESIRELELGLKQLPTKVNLVKRY